MKGHWPRTRVLSYLVSVDLRGFYLVHGLARPCVLCFFFKVHACWVLLFTCTTSSTRIEPIEGREWLKIETNTNNIQYNPDSLHCTVHIKTGVTSACPDTLTVNTRRMCATEDKTTYVLHHMFSSLYLTVFGCWSDWKRFENMFNPVWVPLLFFFGEWGLVVDVRYCVVHERFVYERDLHHCLPVIPLAILIHFELTRIELREWAQSVGHKFTIYTRQ